MGFALDCESLKSFFSDHDSLVMPCLLYDVQRGYKGAMYATDLMDGLMYVCFIVVNIMFILKWNNYFAMNL